MPGLVNCCKTGRHIDTGPKISSVTVANARKLQFTDLENTNEITSIVVMQWLYKLCCIFSTSSPHFFNCVFTILKVFVF